MEDILFEVQFEGGTSLNSSQVKSWMDLSGGRVISCKFIGSSQLEFHGADGYFFMTNAVANSRGDTKVVGYNFGYVRSGRVREFNISATGLLERSYSFDKFKYSKDIIKTG